MLLSTHYTVGEIPHDNHPAPQARRENWLNLNGSWRLCVLETDGKTARLQTQITVPFSPETLLSGVSTNENPFVLQAGERLVYERSFTLQENMLIGCTKLHFGGVDSYCEVYINGTLAGKHRGGYTPFALDITALVNSGENTVKVVCEDEGVRNGDARGKQSDKAGGIWYTPHSGIWQTVWIESMPKTHISSLRITPRIDEQSGEKSVTLRSVCGGETQEVVVYDNGKEILRERYQTEITLCYPFELWSPESPKLYDMTITSESGDSLHSYFGVRTFGMARDKNGIARLTLNGKPYFFNGVLDQGYISDGFLTFPSDEAMVDDISLMKDMGFNTIRKHIKLEPMRWYYHCDRLGIVVWQDFVNGGGEYNYMHSAVLPFLGFHHRDDDYKYFSRERSEGREQFMHALDETVDSLYNCTCIGVWVPFNEGWGQFDSAKVCEYLRSKDNTRIIDSVSGWHDQGVGKTALKSLHIYYTPLKVPKDKRPVVLSEFGGYSLQSKGHVFNEDKTFGYKVFKTQESYVAAVEKLFIKKLKPLIKKGMCAAIYTQLSDVEEEINGLITYDRAVIKMPIEKMRAINAELYSEMQGVE